MSSTGFEPSSVTPQKSSAEVEREVERSRDNLDRTVEALKQKMTPGELIGEARQVMGGAGEKLLAKVMEQARENPLPLAVTGLGLAWLLTSQGKSATDEARSFASSPGSASSGSASSGSAPSGIGAAASAIGERASDLAEDVQTSMRKAADAASHAGDRAGETLQRYGSGIQQTIGDIIDKEPLVIGALGLFVGLAVGAALPATDLENEVVGPLRDGLVDKTQTLAKDALDHAQDAAKAACGAAKAELSPESGAAGNA